MRKRPIISTKLAIDFSNTLYRNFYAQRGLSSNGIPTGGAFGMVKSIVSHIQMYAPDQIIVCKDAPPYIRKRMYPDYKADRSPIEEDVYKQIEQNVIWASDIIDAAGMFTWKQQGYEADDCMAAYAQFWARKRRTRVILLVNDSDLYQCFTQRNNVFLSKKNKLYGIRDFENEFDVPVEKWMLQTALVGSHNAVAGIKGVGPVTAAKAINDPEKLKVLYEKHSAIIKRNLELVVLPLERRKLLVPEFPRLKYNEKKFVKALEAAEIVPTTPILDALYNYHQKAGSVV